MIAVRPFVAVATAAVLLSIGACGTDRTDVPEPPAVTAVSPTFDAADVAFVRALVPHHQQGIALAEVGAQRANRPDLKLLAAAIVATQRDETTRMQGWLSTWQQPPAATPKPDPAVTRLGKVPAADFDRQFLDALIAHQNAAVALARTESGAGANPNALAFAKQVDESRTAEISQMRGYL